jgi:phosphoribosylanthranilate isomerase
MPIQTKICGLSTPETIDAALKGGASHIGLVFFPKSPRNVQADQAAALAARVAGRAQVVGLFVDPEPGFVASVQAQVGLDIIQLHGSESPAQVAAIRAAQQCDVWKAVPVKTRADLALAAAYRGAATHILYDAKPPKGADLPGGTGLRFDWKLLEGASHPLPWILAGGLDAGNVAEAVRITGATMLDVSSGVESAPGIKDVDKIAAFLKAAREIY